MKHAVLPDTQQKPGVDPAFLRHCGQYIADKRPEKIVCLGDFADMSSLSSYDRGKKGFEGRRYKKDIAASHKAMETFLAPIHRAAGYDPVMIMLYGNHEDRITRAIDLQPEFEGVISLEDLEYEKFGWNTVPFLKPINVDGVMYCHYFTSGVMGRPITTASALLTKKHMSCVAGHQQGRQIAQASTGDGRTITGMIIGSCLTPDHEALTADLRYVPLGSLQVGDKLVSFDEVSGYRSRRFKTGTVQAIKIEPAEVCRVELESGKVFHATPDHLWLTVSGSGYRWLTTSQLVFHGPHPRSTIARPLQHWAPALSPEMIGRISCSNEERDGVVSVRPAGVKDIVRIAVDAKTMIVDGYAHHNCYEHAEEYLSHQGNVHWRGMVFLNEVKDGQFDEMPLSLGYLRHRYGK